MADEYGAAGAGAASGAAAGAVAGSVIPGPGTAIGAGVGALVGGVSGYLGGLGAKKRRKAQEKARREYQAALAQYQQRELARNAQREAMLIQQSQQAHNNFQTYMGQKPGDQTAALQQDAANQSSALYAAQAPTPALAGPLAGQYQQEMNQRVGGSVNAMALNYSAGQPSNGSAYTSGSCSTRVFRGGSWNFSPQNLRSANRDGFVPSNRYDIIGFRVARTL